MTQFDIFNGDADGICALQQFRLANPATAELITGVKRDISLLEKVDCQTGDNLNVFDISLDKNKRALQRHIETGAKIIYFDHHFAGDEPSSPNLETHIDTSAETCTSYIVNQYLNGKYIHWAIVGTFGDNFDTLAQHLAEQTNLSTTDIELLKKLGILMNYNGYGSSIDDLHITPIQLYREISRYPQPLDFIKNEATFDRLKTGYDADMSKASQLISEITEKNISLYILPNEKWARRISGVFANKLNKQAPQRAHALLTLQADDSYLVSVRAPEIHKSGADELCRQFATGGGRKAAAGINRLPATDRSKFIDLFRKQFQCA